MFPLLWLSFSAWIPLAWSFHKIKRYLVVIFKVFQKCSDESELLLKVHARILRTGPCALLRKTWAVEEHTPALVQEKMTGAWKPLTHPPRRMAANTPAASLQANHHLEASANPPLRPLHFFWHNFSIPSTTNLSFKAWDSNFRRGRNTLLQLTGHLEQQTHLKSINKLLI